jgi:Tfp pilus assembly protein PilF
MRGALVRRFFRPTAANDAPSDDALAAAGRKLEAGDLQAAADEARRLIAREPANPYAHIILARARARARDLDEAREVLDRALESAAASDLLWAERAELERQAGRPDAAETIYRRGIAVHAESFALANNLGRLLAGEGRLDDAIAVLARAIEKNPDAASLHLDLGRLLISTGDLATAETHLRRAMALDPERRGWRFWLAHDLLMQGRLAEGWAEYESRLEGPGFTWGTASLPRWTGSDASGKRLRVIAEQGLGDSIMFARFITDLVARGARVQFLCRANMVRLFRASFDPASVEVTGDPDADPTGVDAHVHLMSLPHLLRLPREALMAKAPYLGLPTELRAAWRARVASALGEANVPLKVGLMWAGNPDRSRDEDRSLPMALAQRLGDAGNGIAWFNLQVDTERRRTASHPFPMIDLTPEMGDYADSMGLVAAMDLVISVDTSTAHATAALGQPLWLIAPHNVCWRWLIAGEESPWYPNVRMFRAARPREWAPVVERVVSELTALAAGKGA